MKLFYQHYPKYKKNEIPWINEIPDHWKMLKLRNILERVNQKNRPDLPLLSVVRDKGVIKRELSKNDENHNVIPEDLSNHKVVKNGQFAMNKMKAWQGSYGVSKHEGIVSPAYFIFDVKNVDKNFFHVAIRSKAYVPFFNQSSEGVRVDQWDLSIDRMKNVPFFIPPLEEQNAIVHFLDYTDRRIKRYIRAKQKLVKLLEEEKQAIIHQAVTRGLNPDAPMKHSGVDWLGVIPEHWEVTRLKNICRMKSGENITGESIESSGNYPVYGGNGLRGYTSEFTHMGSHILIGRQGALCGNVHLVDGEFWASEHAIVVAIKNKNDLVWLKYLLREMNLNQYSIAAAQPGLSVDKILNLWIPLPDKYEQEEISRYITEKVDRLLRLKKRYEKEISLLQEYRTRLIADVVTGKLDVREAAAQLPEELEEDVEIEEPEVDDEEELQEEIDP